MQDFTQTKVDITAAIEAARQAAEAGAAEHQAQARAFLDAGAEGNVGDFSGPEGKSGGGVR